MGSPQFLGPYPTVEGAGDDACCFILKSPTIKGFLCYGLGKISAFLSSLSATRYFKEVSLGVRDLSRENGAFALSFLRLRSLKLGKGISSISIPMFSNRAMIKHFKQEFFVYVSS